MWNGSGKGHYWALKLYSPFKYMLSGSTVFLKKKRKKTDIMYMEYMVIWK